MEKLQINVRLSQEQIDAIDQKRIELQPIMGKIPNRSEVLRYALDLYLASDSSKNAASNSKAERNVKKS
jgi:Arc/MetJ-type ribon-helix-helix transcriptional regulator